NKRPAVVLITLLLSIGASAQTMPQQTTAAQKATIQGIVIKAGAGQPLKRARVSLRRTGNAQAGQVQGVLGGNAEVRLNEIRTTLESVGAGAQLAQLQD